MRSGPASELSTGDVSRHAAAVSENGRQLLAQGRFEKPLIEAAGFEALAEIAPKGPAQKRTARKMSERDALREAKAELQEARKHEQHLQREARAAEAEASNRKKQLEDAQQRARVARQAADDAASTVVRIERRGQRPRSAPASNQGGAIAAARPGSPQLSAGG